jgi:hypothetical protein
MEVKHIGIPMGYPWPASKLTREDMIKLTELRTRTGKPLTKLLHEAVCAYFALLTQSANVPTEPRPNR